MKVLGLLHTLEHKFAFKISYIKFPPTLKIKGCTYFLLTCRSNNNNNFQGPNM